MIYRAIFRHTLIKALKNATIANAEVYDQPLNDFLLSASHSISEAPRIGVYMRDQEIDFGGTSNFNTCAFKHNLKCRLEIEIAVFGAHLSDDGQTLSVLSQNDRYSGLKMDIIEQQIYDVFYKNKSVYSDSLREKIAKITRYDSVSEYVRDQVDKLSMRTIQIDLELSHYINAGLYGDEIGSKILDRYKEEGADILLECPQIATWLNRVTNTLNNQAENLKAVNIEINSNLDTDKQSPNHYVKVNLDEQS